MPTIDLSRLKQEAAEISEYFSQPEAYLRAVERLLQTYSVPVHRQGRVKGMRPVLPSYEVPPPLMKHLQLEMTLQAEDSPDQALRVADGLWAKRNIETRQLAARLLGAIDGHVDEITRRLEAWALENYEPLLAPELAHEGTRQLAAKYPDDLVTFAGSLLVQKELRLQALAIGALSSLLSDTRYANLPAIFELLAAPTAEASRGLRPDLAALLAQMAERSPQETEFFLMQCLGSSTTPGTAWVARQVMKSLPEESQMRLRPVMKAGP